MSVPRHNSPPQDCAAGPDEDGTQRLLSGFPQACHRALVLLCQAQETLGGDRPGGTSPTVEQATDADQARWHIIIAKAALRAAVGTAPPQDGPRLRPFIGIQGDDRDYDGP